jgi:hypothetical protein
MEYQSVPLLLRTLETMLTQGVLVESDAVRLEVTPED